MRIAISNVRERLRKGRERWGGWRPMDRVLAFGALSGFVWSLVPFVVSKAYDSPLRTAGVFLPGALTGVLISFALWPILRRRGRVTALFFGALSLPAGAFVFGVTQTLMEWGVLSLGMDPQARAVFEFAPLKVGGVYAVWSVLSVFAYVLFPLAVCTTILLRRVAQPSLRLPRSA